MSEALLFPLIQAAPDRTDPAAVLDDRIADLAGRLAMLLGTDHPGTPFMREFAAQGRSTSVAATTGPLDRLAAGLRLGAAEMDLLVLAAAPEAHEGLAAIIRGLHPHGRDRPTLGLAASLAAAGLLPAAPASERDARLWVRHLVLAGPLSALLDPAERRVPLPDRTLALPDGLFEAMVGEPGWPAAARELEAELVAKVPSGLRAEQPDIAGMLRACAQRVTVTVLIQGCGDPVGAAARLAVLLRGTGGAPVVLTLPDLTDAVGTALGWAALARGRTPLLVPGIATDGLRAVRNAPGPVIVVAPPGYAEDPDATGSRPVLVISVPPATEAQRSRLWSALLPELTQDDHTRPPSGALPVVLAAARDTAAMALITGRPPTRHTLRTALRRQHANTTPDGVQRIQPIAGWADLVLPEDRLRLLREAVDQVRHQETVLGRWGFLPGRPGRTGVRLLFSGPPGTGKTLAAEVLAGQIGRDLLAVDLSRMVSKWIGETEKNLSAAFDAAERGEAVLFFDEADSLFGKRTEVNDARDRYANLQTAYLLGRLAVFDGVAVLATNVRQNLDQAFTRRLEFVVGFDLPDEAERLRLWHRHLPVAAPVGATVNLADFAERYPITGALVRNAAVGAAYLAAGTGGRIEAQHLAWAVRREYMKAGRAYPGPPAGVPDLPPDDPDRTFAADAPIAGTSPHHPHPLESR